MKLVVPPPLQGLITGAAMWWLNRALPAFAFSFPGHKALALTFIAAAIGIELTAVAMFFRARTTVNPLAPHKSKVLVAKGLYRISRNPMYLGLALLLTGWLLWLGNPLNALLLIAFVLYITAFQIKPEEAALREIFGEDFDTYAHQVRRWI